jgi:hypothetical protein
MLTETLLRIPFSVIFSGADHSLATGKMCKSRRVFNFRKKIIPRNHSVEETTALNSNSKHVPDESMLSILFGWSRIFCKTIFFMPFPSVPSFGIDSSVNLGMPRNEHCLPRNDGSCSESILRNFFGTKLRCQP